MYQNILYHKQVKLFHITYIGNSVDSNLRELNEVTTEFIKKLKGFTYKKERSFSFKKKKS